MLKAYPFKGVTLPSIMGCGREGVGPIMLVAEGIFFDAMVVEEGIVVYQLIKCICIGCIGRSKAANESTLFLLFQYGGESATVRDLAFTKYVLSAHSCLPAITQTSDYLKVILWAFEQDGI